MYNFAVNHDEAATLVRANGSNITYIIEGEPGSSKSSILKTIESLEGDRYEYIYIDAPLKDIPDIALTMPHHESQTTRAYINQIWMGKDANKPKIVMIDEVFKCTPYVQLMLNRLMLDHYVGDYQLPAGSIVFGTTNFATDGVGDKTNGHTNSRVARIPMRKPNQVEWTKWAVNNNINPFILTWIGQNPAIFSSYKDPATTSFDAKLHADGQGIFQYIYHPQHNAQAYVCPRTLELASHQLNNLDKLGEELTIKALIGTVGGKAALDMGALLALGADLPSPDEVMSNPTKCKLPKSVGAQMILVYKSLNYITAGTIDAWAEYIGRMGLEVRAVWVKTMRHQPELLDIMSRNRQLVDWVVDNSIVL
jgi:hypothetical protein